jgi:hypothetical protein
VSPKSTLDQGFWWEESSQCEPSSSATDDSDVTSALAPADRVRALAGDVDDDWTWTGDDEPWITVFSADTAESFEAEEAGGSPTAPSSEDPHIGGEEQHMALDAGSSGNSASASDCNNKGVINLRAPSLLVNSILPLRPSWQPFFHFLPACRFHALLFTTFPAGAASFPFFPSHLDRTSAVPGRIWRHWQWSGMTDNSRPSDIRTVSSAARHGRKRPTGKRPVPGARFVHWLPRGENKHTPLRRELLCLACRPSLPLLLPSS